MATPNEYIVFEPDQVLTNDHLNETFNYLDQQNRFTRNKLIGIGIVCGLQIVQQPAVIEITKGCGVTSQGYLITQDTTQYPYYMPYTAIDAPNKLPFAFDKDYLPFYKPFWADKTIWLLLSDAQFNALEDAQKLTAKTLSSAEADFLSDYVVALFWEAKESDLKNCDTQDCNNKGEKMTFQIRPLLVAKNDLYGNVSNIIMGDHPKLSLANHVQLKRFNVPYTELKSTDNIINAFVSLVDDLTLSQVAEAYNSCYQKYGSVLKVRTNPFTDLKEGLGKYRDLIVKENPLFIEYFYDFIDDLIKAYHEFNHKVSDVISTCCPDENLFPLHLILGDASLATNAYEKDSYRNYFIYSPLFSKMGTEAAELKLLFGRMVLMVKNFTIQSIELMRKTTIMITPSKYEFSPLSERAIPYYYNVAESGAELYKSWNYYKTSKGQATLNLSYNAGSYSNNPQVTQPLLYDIEHFNFFRVEGHVGQDYKTVISNVLNQRLTYNLPFDVVAIAADRLSYLDVDLPETEIRDLETDYDLIVSEATCKIHTTFCFVSKLPYSPPRVIRTNFPGGFSAQPEAKSEGKSLSFAEFKVNAIRTAEPLAPLNKDDGYKKGDFMRNYCPVLENTLGSYYLSALTDTGMFNNPIGNYTSGSLNELYACLFEFIDSVEEMMAILNTNDLSSFDIYYLRSSAQRYLNATAQIVTVLKNVLIKDPTKVNEVPSVIREGDINTLIDDFEMLFNICIEDRLQVLNDERTIRLIKYAKELSFLNYYKKHPGLEHKAGVPKGGTLVLVYKNYINRGLTREIPKEGGAAVKTAKAPDLAVKQRLTRMEAAPVASKNILLSPDLDESTLNQFRKIVSDSQQVSDTEKVRLIDILAGRGRVELKEEQSYDIDDNVVIADFYIPYLCPPIDHDDAVIEPPPPPPVRKPVISMGNTFCDNDNNPAAITVSVPGGKFNEVKGLDGAKQTFTPAIAGAGSFTIVYTVNDLSSDPFTVTVLPTPSSGFTVKAGSAAGTNTPGSNNPESISRIIVTGSTVSGTFIPDSQNTLFTYNWQFTGAQVQSVSADGVAKVIVNIPRDGGIIEQPVEIRVALTVSNGNCHQSTNIRSFQVSSGGFSEGGDSMFRGEESLKEKGQPDLEIKKGDTPVLTTKEEKKPDLEIKKGDTPVLTTKEEKKPDLEIKKGDTPVLTTKEEKKPDLEIKKGDTPILTTKEEKKPDLEIKKGDASILTTKEEKKPDLELKRTDKPDAVIKEEKTPDLGTKESLKPNLRVKATDKLNIRKKKEE